LDAIPGTTIFDSTQARKGYALNRMCFSFNSPVNRAAFVADEEGYCRQFDLNAEQRRAVFGLNVQDIGAQQTGMSLRDFKAKLAAAGS